MAVCARGDIGEHYSQLTGQQLCCKMSPQRVLRIPPKANRRHRRAAHLAASFSLYSCGSELYILLHILVLLCDCALPQSKKERRDRTRVSDLSSQKDGGYLLSLRTSTIGAIGLNFSVRNGKRWIPNAITT